MIYFSFHIFAEDNTGIFNPKSYHTDSLSDLEEFIADLASITAHGGGDAAEFGIRAIKRAINASIRITCPDNNVYSHILVFTDAPAKDYRESNCVCNTLSGTDVKIHSFLPNGVTNSLCGMCNSSTYENCIRGSTRIYADLAEWTNGILVNDVTSNTALDRFIREYNTIGVNTPLRPVTCNTRTTSKKRAAPTVSVVAPGYTREYFTVSEIATRVVLIITPGLRDRSRYVPTTVTITNSVGLVVRTQVIRDITVISFEGSSLTLGVWTVSGSTSFILDALIENDIRFSADVLNETTSEPLCSLPPTGCVRSLPILIFTPEMDKLHTSRAQYINVVTSNGALLQKVPLSRCGSYFRGHVLVPLVPFYLEFRGITKLGHQFIATVFNRLTPTPLSCKVTAISAPRKLSAGGTVDYNLRLTTSSLWPSCSVKINVKATTTLCGVTSSPITSRITLTATSPPTFRVRVSAASGASAGRGRLQLQFTDDDGRIYCENSDAIIELEVSDYEHVFTSHSFYTGLVNRYMYSGNNIIIVI